MSRFFVLAIAVFAAACSTKPEPVDTTIPFGGHYALGAPVVAENLTVWPVYSDRALDIGEFLTLREAQEKGLAEVREVGAEGSNAETLTEVLEQTRGAVVGQLSIENRSRAETLPRP